MLGKSSSIPNTLSGGKIKINASDSDEYRTIDKYLESIKCLYYTYQNKQTRPYSVMLKGLPGGIDIFTVLSTIKKEYPLLKPLNVTQKLRWRTKEKVDMYIVDFESGADVKGVHDVSSVERYYGHNQVSYAQAVASGTVQSVPQRPVLNMESMIQTIVTQFGQMQQQMLDMSQKIEALENKPKSARSAEKP